jgi:hypothetical protein
MVRARPYTGGVRLLPMLYLVIGAIVATQHHYFSHLATIKLIVSALLALVLWPLVLLGVNVHL